MTFYRNLSYSQFSWVFRTLLSILADVNSDMVRIISILPLVYNFFRFLSRPLKTVPSATTATGITVTSCSTVFVVLFCSLAKTNYLFIFLLSFIFTLRSTETPKSTKCLFFCFVGKYRVSFAWELPIPLSPHNLLIQFLYELSIDDFNIYSFRVFHIRVSWWSFTGFWVTASLLKSPGLFSVFWPFSIM